jgi:Na+-translocating ferredoxin:NAD+ oxidoreductase subunit C
MPAESESTTAKTTGVWPEQIPEFSKIPLASILNIPIGIRGAGEGSVKPPGTRVRRGEPLVDHAAESWHIPLAPADGTLGNVRPIRLTTGGPAVAVELNVSGEAPPELADSPASPEEVVTLVEGLERIRSAGIWSLRHASPDLIGQLNQIVARPVDTLICTILDSDASLRLSSTLAARYSKRLVAGVAQLAKIAGVRRAVLVVESFATDMWMRPLWEAAVRAELPIVDLANEYPQSDPTLMVYSLTRRRLTPGVLPTTRGVLVLDAIAAMAIGNGFCQQPMLTVPLAVHDHENRHSHFLQVPVGTSIEHVLTHLRIPADDSTLRGGDLLRDIAIRLDSIIAGGELTIHVTTPETPVIPEPCIRCAWCFEACPTLIHPAFILDAAQRRDMKMAERAGIGACIECGICAHVCPSRLPLLDAIRQVRKTRCE